MPSTLYAYQILCMPELFGNIFGHSSNADIAALARTCRSFKEPALDLLWEELDSLSPLVRCLPDACHLSILGNTSNASSRNIRYYHFSRPPNKAEQDILRGYTRRVRFIRHSKTLVYLQESAILTIFNLDPLTEPLFPNLRSLYLELSTAYPLQHVAVPSLTSLHVHVEFPGTPIALDFFDLFGDRCPHVKELVVRTFSNPDGGRIARQVCRWPDLHRVDCQDIALTMDAIMHLSSVPNLKQLSFKAEIDKIHHVSHLGSKLVFPSLAVLYITSVSIDTITLFLSHTRLPAAQSLAVTISGHVSRRAVQAYWTAAREACPSCPSLIFLHLMGLPILNQGHVNPTPLTEDDVNPRLTSDVLYPCTAFSELRTLDVNLDWDVSLTDADLLQLASPRMERIVINNVLGWRVQANGGGITVNGLVQLLRQCPSLNKLCIAIDTSTFTEIPEGLDFSLSSRKGLSIDFVDSYILPGFVPGVVSVFMALKLDPTMFTVWGMFRGGVIGEGEELPLWERVRQELRRASTG